MLAYVEERLIQVLRGKDNNKAYAHLSSKDRKAILEILMETKMGFRTKVNASVQNYRNMK